MNAAEGCDASVDAAVVQGVLIVVIVVDRSRDDDGACATISRCAAFLGAGLTQLAPKIVEHSGLGVNVIDLVRSVIKQKCDQEIAVEKTDLSYRKYSN